MLSRSKTIILIGCQADAVSAIAPTTSTTTTIVVVVKGGKGKVVKMGLVVSARNSFIVGERGGGGEREGTVHCGVGELGPRQGLIRWRWPCYGLEGNYTCGRQKCAGAWRLALECVQCISELSVAPSYNLK